MVGHKARWIFPSVGTLGNLGNIWRNFWKMELAYVRGSEGDRKRVIRFKNLGQKIVFNDFNKGEISFDTKELGDFWLLKVWTSRFSFLMWWTTGQWASSYHSRRTHGFQYGPQNSWFGGRWALADGASGLPQHYASFALILATPTFQTPARRNRFNSFLSGTGLFAGSAGKLSGFAWLEPGRWARDFLNGGTDWAFWFGKSPEKRGNF